MRLTHLAHHPTYNLMPCPEPPSGTLAHVDAQDSGWEGRQTRASALVNDRNLWMQSTEEELGAAEEQEQALLHSWPCTPLEPPARGCLALPKKLSVTLIPQSHLKAETDQRHSTILPEKSVGLLPLVLRIRSGIV